jgi:uncharacterized protein with HEPN domain
MLDAADAVASYVARGRGNYDQDSAIRDAIVYQIIVLGEASKAVMRADPELTDDLSTIDWSPLARMKDRLTHQYWAVDPEIVWSTATQDVPAIRNAVAAGLKKLGK